MRRSASGAAVRRTRGGKLGRAWGCVCFGRENRNRFSRRAGLRVGLGFGLCFGPSFCGSLSRAVRCHLTRRTATRRSSLYSPLAANCYRLRANSAIPRGIAGFVAQRRSRSGEWATGRTRQIWGEFLVVLWAVLLRFVEPPGLRAGPFGPPPERAARTRQNWGGEWGVVVATRRVARAARGQAPARNTPLRVENCDTTRASDPLRSNKSRVEAASC